MMADRAGTADSTLGRWLKFNVAGLLGVGMQLLVLAALMRYASLSYLAATPIAVEAAILHNFMWHERYTWASRRHLRNQSAWKRCLQFNLTNGGVSLMGNLVLMKSLVERAHMPVLGANLCAIAICSGVNFLLAEYFVFAAEKNSVGGECGQSRRAQQSGIATQSGLHHDRLLYWRRIGIFPLRSDVDE